MSGGDPGAIDGTTDGGSDGASADGCATDGPSDVSGFQTNLAGEMDDLTGFQRDLLYIVAGVDEPHGLAIKDELESYYEKEVHHGRLYPNLDTLVESGLVHKGEKDKRTNVYTLTPRGRREIRSRLQWEDDHAADIEETTW